MPQDVTNTWTKWWWLRVYQWGNWSVEERRASILLWLTCAGVVVLVFLLILARLSTLHLDAGWTVVIALGAALLITLPSARIASGFFPAKVDAGDAAAAERLGGSVPEIIDQPRFPSLWWLDYKSRGIWWSPEEIATRRTIWTFAGLSFLVEALLALAFLHGMNQRVVAIGLLFGFALSLFLSRWLCGLIWPDDVKHADALAYERLCKEGRRRTEVA
jgi:hypothetical protein